MREIKFRVWCIDQQEYEKEETYLTPDGRLFRKYVLDGKWRDDTKLHIVEQYTGLTDQNGVEIYEGDIYQFQFMQELYKGVIVYKEELARFVIELEDLCGKFYEFPKQTDDVNYFSEVIGNIHETELK